MRTPWVFNVQRFSIHDGPGIRTTVFFKGCPLSCRWCHNPESQRFERQLMLRPERCVGCGHCAGLCPSPDRCTGCGRCAEACASEARQMVGEAYAPAQLAALLLRDRGFYDTSGGGVTLSGGEVMAQDTEYLLALLRPLKRQGVHVAIDTCGHAPYERFERILPYADLFLYDIKAADPALHLRYTGVDNALILENARRLSQTGARIHVRVPTIPGVNADDNEMRAIISLVRREIHAEQINLLPYHKVGQDKAAHLKDAPLSECFTPPSAERMEEIKQMWLDAGFSNVCIGG